MLGTSDCCKLMKRRVYLESSSHIGCGAASGEVVLLNNESLFSSLLEIDRSHQSGIAGTHHNDIKLGQFIETTNHMHMIMLSLHVLKGKELHD